MFRNQTNFKQPFRSLNYPPYTSSFSHYMLSIIIFQKKIKKNYRTYWMWEKNFFILCMNILLFFTYNRHTHTHMLYQLVNKTLETRLLFLLKPICSIIFMNLSISFPFAPDFFGVNENDSLFRPETGELFCSTKGGGSSISSHNLPAACCVMMRWWVKYAHRCWHFLFSVCGC